MKAPTGWIAIVLSAATVLHGQQLRSLKTVAVPEPPGLDRYVANRQALIVLGKAMFWDMQAGSDGRTACATCHFHAGADHRSRNQLVDPANPFPANHQLVAEDFPFRVLADPLDRNSTVVRDSSVRAGSAGLFRRAFVGVLPGQPADLGEEVLDKPEFQLDGMQLRRVTVRNSPTVINAVFQIRNFWDGRAARIFNGFNPFGDASQTPGVFAWRDGAVSREPVRLDNASLASQAVGPALDLLEMSYEGRSWRQMGRKLLSLPPLGLQQVASDDSVLGPLAAANNGGSGPGLRVGITYRDLVQAAFQPAYWAAPAAVEDGYMQIEANFSLFWGLALMAYQSTLVSADTPLDRFIDGDRGALTAEQQSGLQLYQGGAARCSLCHGGAETTAAAFSTPGGRGGNAGRAFQRTGVRPVTEDSGLNNGTFKSSPLRNVEFTGPYFHNGGQATLEQVVEFYARGGDFANGAIRPFNTTPAQRASLVALLKALTDDRVRFERAPFDHPELCVPNGHLPQAQPAGDGFARSTAEAWAAIPAVGAAGNAVPLQTFDELLRGVGKDGSRAHALEQACTIRLP